MGAPEGTGGVGGEQENGVAFMAEARFLRGNVQKRGLRDCSSGGTRDILYARAQLAGILYDETLA